MQKHNIRKEKAKLYPSNPTMGTKTLCQIPYYEIDAIGFTSDHPPLQFILRGFWSLGWILKKFTNINAWNFVVLILICWFYSSYRLNKGERTPTYRVMSNMLDFCIGPWAKYKYGRPVIGLVDFASCLGLFSYSCTSDLSSH